MKKILLMSGVALSFLFTSCDKDDDDSGSSSSSDRVSITGLEDLGDDFAYEGWIIVNGSPVSTGVFSLDEDGNYTASSISNVTEEQIEQATDFVVTIEPVPDSDPAPAATKILEGSFEDGEATLTTSTIGTGFETATGKFIIATPTSAASDDENSGIWFLDNSGSSPVAGLELPTLEAGWVYEGWVVIDGVPVTTGTFTDPDGADDTNQFSGTDGAAAPAYPGEDFIMNAPSGLIFPTDIRGDDVVITIEPSPDNSSDPFLLKPLAGKVPETINGTPYSLTNDISGFPTGTIKK